MVQGSVPTEAVTTLSAAVMGGRSAWRASVAKLAAARGSAEHRFPEEAEVLLPAAAVEGAAIDKGPGRRRSL